MSVVDKIRGTDLSLPMQIKLMLLTLSCTLIIFLGYPVQANEAINNVVPNDDPIGQWKRKNTDWIHTGTGLSGYGRNGFVEPCLVEWHPGKLLLYGRTDKGWFYESRSSDYGATWSAPIESKVRCAIMTPLLKRIPGSDYIALLWTSILKSKTKVNDPSKRLCLASMISKNGGMTWENYRQIEYDGINYHSYPWILFDGDSLHLSHERQGATNVRGMLRDMYYTKLSSDWFTGKN